MKCLLCESTTVAPFKVLQKPEKSYFHCAQCDLIFMNPEERLTPAEEKARYDHHQNESSAGYLEFLTPLIRDVDQLVKSKGRSPGDLTTLDFGCGPTAFLGSQFFAKGYKSYSYDIYYYPDQEQLRRTYDVITSTEVWEHLYQPKQEIERQLRMLKSGGILGVMTSAHKGEAAFHSWHYRRDLTHVCFYSEQTMKWLAETYKLKIFKALSPYWLFQKL